jgi:hypothetical protein
MSMLLEHHLYCIDTPRLLRLIIPHILQENGTRSQVILWMLDVGDCQPPTGREERFACSILKGISRLRSSSRVRHRTVLTCPLRSILPCPTRRGELALPLPLSSSPNGQGEPSTDRWKCKKRCLKEAALASPGSPIGSGPQGDLFWLFFLF